MKKSIKLDLSSVFAEMAISYKTTGNFTDMPVLSGNMDTNQFLRKIWDADQIEYREEFVLLMLNRRNKLIGWVKISSGGTAGTIADPKIIFQHALLSGCSSIILSHNHPSGSLKPSYADMAITEKLVNAGRLLEIEVLDHVIMTADSSLSFKSEGLM